MRRMRGRARGQALEESVVCLTYLGTHVIKPEFLGDGRDGNVYVHVPRCVPYN